MQNLLKREKTIVSRWGFVGRNKPFYLFFFMLTNSQKTRHGHNSNHPDPVRCGDRIMADNPGSVERQNP